MAVLETFEHLRAKLADYMSTEDLNSIEKAYLFAEHAHSGQYRLSGDPYIHHPIAVACILADLHLDKQVICASLLHDVAEDTQHAISDLSTAFGKEIALLVDGVTKIERVEQIDTEIREAETLRKMLLAIAKDWRVIFIKLADRLHNMRTLKSIPKKEKRRKIAQRTLDIYAPIANRIGITPIWLELQDLSLMHLHPHRYSVLVKAQRRSHKNIAEMIDLYKQEIDKKINGLELTATIETRQKSIYSIYRKMNKFKQPAFSKVEDIVGFRILVQERIECYLVLGVLHELFQPLPLKFKDYVATPKANGYQSLHTTVFSQDGTKIEIQIRTQQMHKFALFGMAAHWIYKGHGPTLEKEVSHVQKHAMQTLTSLLRLQKESNEAKEFLEHAIVDLIPDEIYVLTPQGKIVILPKGATALDFAYKIHTRIGDFTSSSIINGQYRHLSTELHSGDQVQINTNEDRMVIPQWLDYVRTAKARSRIRSVLRNQNRKEAISIGKLMLLNALKKHGAGVQTLTDQLPGLLAANAMKSQEDIYIAIGLGDIAAEVAALNLLKRADIPDSNNNRQSIPIKIKGTLSSSKRLASCCNPIPFEPIIGIVKKPHGLIIHASACLQMNKQSKKSEKWIDALWDQSAAQELYIVKFDIFANNERGMITRTTECIMKQNLNIVTCILDDAQIKQKTVSLKLTIEVNNYDQLLKLWKAMYQLSQVINITYRNEIITNEQLISISTTAKDKVKPKTKPKKEKATKPLTP